MLVKCGSQVEFAVVRSALENLCLNPYAIYKTKDKESVC